jgi:hypothetical protein
VAVVAAAALVAVAVVTWRVTTGGSDRLATARAEAAVGPVGLSQVFSSSSFWYREASDDTVAPESPGLVARLVDQIHTYYGTVAVNTTSYSVPLYLVGPRQKAVTVRVRSCAGGTATFAEQQLAAVPIPPDAVPASGTDGELIVWQPSTDTEWELWRAINQGGSWSACTGGMLRPASQSSGVFPNPSGVSASGLSIFGGLITLAELHAGVIDHVISVGIPETALGFQVAPADRNDGWSSSSIAIPEGTVFRLDPAVDVNALPLSRAGKTIATALQRYGMVVADTSGAVAVPAQDPTPLLRAGASDPYRTLFGTTPTYQLLNGIPWDRMQAVDPLPASG